MKVYKIECRDFFKYDEEEFIYASFEKAKKEVEKKINKLIAKVLDENKDKLEDDDFAYYFVEVEEKGLDNPVKEYPEVFKSINKVSKYITEITYSSNYGKHQTWEYKVNYNMFRDGETYIGYNYSIIIKEFNLIM